MTPSDDTDPGITQEGFERDTFPSDMQLVLEILKTEQRIRLRGQTVVERGPPRVDGDTFEIRTRLVTLDMIGGMPLGQVRLRLNPDMPSHGFIRGTWDAKAGAPRFPAESQFTVFVIAKTPLAEIANTEPLIVKAKIRNIPPYDDPYEHGTDFGVPLHVVGDPDTLIALLREGRHTPRTPHECDAHILADTDRDAQIETPRDEAGKADWTWGPRGRGAIALFNCDDDGTPTGFDFDNAAVDTSEDVTDLAALRIFAWPAMPAGWKARLTIPDVTVRDRIRVFDQRAASGTAVLGRNRTDPYEIPDLRSADLIYGIEALSFPERGFDPPEFDVVLQIFDENDRFQCEDCVRFRVAPWLMVWNGRPTRTVYAVRINRPEASRARFNNAAFIDRVQRIVRAAGARFVEVDGARYGFDRWIQDEIEIGYTRAPFQQFDVVFDSPRNRGLDPFPELELIGADFGFVTRSATPNSLDSFGNLEVSPPVRAGGKDYKLGRIIYGGPVAGGTGLASRRMAAEVREFLLHQVVQHPIEIPTAWLNVGHVDEAISFIPARGLRGFRMLIASPARALRILRFLRRIGLGRTRLLRGRTNSTGFSLETTVRDVLANRQLVDYNGEVQRILDGIRRQLVRDLGLRRRDIIPVPVLFEDEVFFAHGVRAGADALTANVVNVQVVNRNLLIARPFGPTVLGIDIFEAWLRARMMLLGNRLHFIDDWDSYHVLRGEVHCGTNARRRPPFSVFWWQMEEP